MPVFVEDFEVVPVLTRLRLPKEVLLDVVDRATGERANVTESDPSGTAGTEMRRWCTRFLRDEPSLRKLGWTPCTHSQVDGIRNDELQVKVVFMNTDARTGVPSKAPHSVSEKGNLTERFIQRNSESGTHDLFGNDEIQESDPIANYDFWYLCAHASERHIAAELSRPIGLTAGIVDQYSDRVILWQPGEKDGLRRGPTIPEDFADVQLPDVQIK